MSGFSSGLGRGVHIRAVSQNIRHRRCYSFLYGNSEAHLLLGTPRDISLKTFYFGYFIGRIITHWRIFSSSLWNRGETCNGWLNKKGISISIAHLFCLHFCFPGKELVLKGNKQYKCEWNKMDLNVSYRCSIPKSVLRHNLYACCFTHVYTIACFPSRLGESKLFQWSDDCVKVKRLPGL